MVPDLPQRVQEVLGFHGTSKESAAVIIGDGFRVSANDYDWLGTGVYFWQDAPLRAWEWARKIHGEEAAVVGARIKLDGCMDLLDVGWRRYLSAAKDAFVHRWKAMGRAVPTQKGGAHWLDCAVIDFAVTEFLPSEGIYIGVVRAAFSEGDPLWESSSLYSKSHVQIAIRNLTLIREVWIEDEGDAR